MRIAIAIATTGRPEVLRQTLLRLERQTRQADEIIVVGAAPGDAPDMPLPAGAQFHIGSRGPTFQRNHALEVLREKAEIVAFIDDDYVPARDFVAGVANLMQEHPEVVAASGYLLADGFHSAGLSFDEADALIAGHEAAAAKDKYVVDDTGTYGCNMVMRISAVPDVRFDENLPLYAWLEDTDFSAQFAKAGRVVRTNHFAGVHLGAKSGRVSGVRLGYSQIANSLYLAKKGTLAKRRAVKMVVKQILVNAVKSLRPEPWIDRAGRLRGNLIAIGDILRFKSNPGRVLEL